MEIMIITIVLLIACSAFFSASETALTSANRIRLKSKAEEGSKGAKMALKLLDKYDKVITTILIGNNIVNIAASSIATVLFTTLIDEVNGPLVATIALTLALLAFGEVMPKSIAKDHSEGLTIGTSGIISFLTFIFTPLSLFFTGLKKLVSLIFGKGDKEVSVTEQELLAIIDEIEDEGVLEEQERDLVKSALVFDETMADEIITHRVDITAVDINEDTETVKNIFISEEYSRLPVYEGSVDKIVGFISQKEFFKRYLTRKEGENIMLRDIVQDIIFAPHLMKISDIMKQMQKEKIHMAVVLDQYGGTLGIVTLEDILEQLVGEIWDENDEIVAPVTFVTDTVFHVNGDVSLNDFRRYWHNRTGSNPLIDSNARTVGGWILELFGKIPETQESVKTADFNITVLKVSDRRIKKISFQVIEKEE